MKNYALENLISQVKELDGLGRLFGYVKNVMKNLNG